MPASYAHQRFGAQVLKTMPAEQRQCVQRFRRMFDAGLHGPDIFFYYNPFWKNAVCDLARDFHRQTGQEFFRAACKAASSEAARAYLYGLLAHYCLDSLCHPLVNQLDSIGEAKHTLLESEFDRYLLALDGEQDPAHFDAGKRLRLTRGECMTAAEFYPGVEGGQVNRSVKAMAFFIRYLATGNVQRKKAFLDKLKPGLTDHMIPAEENEEFALYVRELKDRYDEAAGRYPFLLEAITAHMDSGRDLGGLFEPNFG